MPMMLSRRRQKILQTCFVTELTHSRMSTNIPETFMTPPSITTLDSLVAIMTQLALLSNKIKMGLTVAKMCCQQKMKLFSKQTFEIVISLSLKFLMQ